MRGVVQTRLSRRLLGTSAAGALADWTVFAALVALVARMTDGSVFAVAMVTSARLVPSVILGPLLAPYAGLLGARRTIAFADATRGAVIVSLPFMTSLGRLAAALLALEFASALSAATRESVVSTHVAPASFARFNTATAVLTYGMLPIGGVLAAGLGVATPLLPFAVAGAIHAADSALLASTREIAGGRRPRRRISPLAGLRGLRRPGPFRDTVAAATLGVLCIAMLFSVGSVVATDLFGRVDRYGYLLGLLGAGALPGAWLAGRGGSAATGLLHATIGSVLLATSSLPGGITGTVLIGTGAAVAYVDTQSRLQRVARHPEDFAAAFAIIKMGTVAALVAAPLVQRTAGSQGVATVMVALAAGGTAWYARRVEGRRVAAVLVTALGRPILRAAVRVRVEGRVPDSGAVLASNHPSLLDGPLMMALDDRVRPIAKPQPRPAVALALRLSGALLVGGHALQGAVDHLRRGGLVWLAPEGRMTGAVLGRGRSGAARMATQAGAPVVPVFIDYGGTAGPRLQQWRPWRRPVVRVTFGAPMLPGLQEPAETVTRQLMTALSELTGIPPAAPVAGAAPASAL